MHSQPGTKFVPWTSKQGVPLNHFPATIRPDGQGGYEGAVYSNGTLNFIKLPRVPNLTSWDLVLDAPVGSKRPLSDKAEMKFEVIFQKPMDWLRLYRAISRTVAWNRPERVEADGERSPFWKAIAPKLKTHVLFGPEKLDGRTGQKLRLPIGLCITTFHPDGHEVLLKHGDRSSVLFIEYFGLLPGAQRKGYGKFMHQSMVHYCELLHPGAKILLDTSTRDLTSVGKRLALDFYLDNGFQLIGNEYYLKDKIDPAAWNKAQRLSVRRSFGRARMRIARYDAGWSYPQVDPAT